MWPGKSMWTKKRRKQPKRKFQALGGFRVDDKKSKGHRYIHKVSFTSRIAAQKELENKRGMKLDVIMRKYKKDGKTYYGIFQRSTL